MPSRREEVAEPAAQDHGGRPELSLRDAQVDVRAVGLAALGVVADVERPIGTEGGAERTVLVMLLRLYLAGRVLAQRARTIVSDERGDVVGWVLIAGMTVVLVTIIATVTISALRGLLTRFFSQVGFGG
jgi:hypothetical protein